MRICSTASAQTRPCGSRSRVARPESRKIMGEVGLRGPFVLRGAGGLHTNSSRQTQQFDVPRVPTYQIGRNAYQAGSARLSRQREALISRAFLMELAGLEPATSWVR